MDGLRAVHHPAAVGLCRHTVQPGMMDWPAHAHAPWSCGHCLPGTACFLHTASIHVCQLGPPSPHALATYIHNTHSHTLCVMGPGMERAWLFRASSVRSLDCCEGPTRLMAGACPVRTCSMIASSMPYGRQGQRMRTLPRIGRPQTHTVWGHRSRRFTRGIMHASADACDCCTPHICKGMHLHLRVQMPPMHRLPRA